jgi:hypothetical protein
MDKARYLKEQSDEALAAMRATVKAARQDALNGLDPRRWARSHPWKSTAVAAASGFAAARTVRRPQSPSGPREPTHVGRFMVRWLKRGIRIALAAAQPIAQELWATYNTPVNGDSVEPSGNPADHTAPTNEPSEAPNGP